jgi:predicted NUDIX family NTP pyrophosphohydrolase
MEDEPMPSKRSAGVLFHRPGSNGLQVLLVHPGGPMWSGRGAGAWQIPKGLVEEGEDDETAARREASEELGIPVEGPLASLGDLRQSKAKTVAAFACAMDVDVALVASNTVEIEWPPRSGRTLTIPEISEARWFGIDDARAMMLPSQIPLLDRLADLAGADAIRS